MFFTICIFSGCGKSEPEVVAEVEDKYAMVPYDMSVGDRRLEWGRLNLSGKLPLTDSELSRERTLKISETVARIEKELTKNGGTWDAWRAGLAPVISDVKKLYENDPYNPDDLNYYVFIKAANDFFYHKEALELIVKQGSIKHKHSPVDTFIQLTKDLKARGIDLIYVPVPMDIEIYPEFASANANNSMIIAPELRRIYLEMLQGGVEVVDLLGVFKTAKREAPDEDLYIPLDNHWSNYAVRLAAKEIGRRLSRYPFIRETQLNEKPYMTQFGDDPHSGKAYSRLPEELKKKTEPIRLSFRSVFLPDGQKYEEPDDAKVRLIGDSFAYYFNERFHAGIMAHVAKEIRQPVAFYASSGLFPSFLRRDVNRLFSGDCKVVLYVQDARQLLPRDDWEPLVFD